MIRIAASIMRGQGDAFKNHKILIPQLTRYFPEVADCRHFGTINLALEMPLFKSLADHWTPKIRWRPCWLSPHDPDTVEAFGFMRIRFECPPGADSRHAWVIVPEWAKLSHFDFGAEVITDALVPSVAYGASCVIELDDWPSVLRPMWFGKRAQVARDCGWAPSL